MDEETGLQIENVQCLTTTESFFEAEDKHYVTIFMTATIKADANGDVPQPIVSSRKHFLFRLSH